MISMHKRPIDYSIERCRLGDRNCATLKEARQDGLDSVKYVCSKLRLEYKDILYEDSSSYAKNIRIACHFHDLDGAKYVLKKAQRTYPHELYDSKLPFAEQLRISVDLLDLEGIKYIYNSNNNNYSAFYLDHNDKYRLEFATKIGDVDFIQRAKYSFAEADLTPLIARSYYEEKLDIAEALLNKWRELYNKDVGIKLFSAIISNIIRHNQQISCENYTQHFHKICSLNLLNHEQCNVANNLIESMMHKSEAKNELSNFMTSFYTNSKIFDKNIFSNIKLHHTIYDVMKVAKASNILGKLEYFIPDKGIGAIYVIEKINDLHKENIIYVPLSESNFYAALVHETCHAVMYLIYNNHGYPYVTASEQKYIKALNQTLANIYSRATKGEFLILSKDLKTYLWLNTWYRSEEKSVEFTNAIFKLFYDSDSLNITQKELFLKMNHQRIAKKYEWDEELSYVLDRLQDYLNRKDEEKPGEFLPRVLEFYTSGISDETMNLFECFDIYWNHSVQPAIESFIARYDLVGHCVAE